jgi:hypothetical protein
MGSGLDLETVKVTDLETVKGWDIRDPAKY